MLVHGKREAGAMAALFLIIVGVIALYVSSLFLSPYVKCSRCNNKPKRRGFMFSYAHHVCPKCKGTGQQVRLGTRVLDSLRGKSR
jgi:excinuclease UvrABC ATPase subunit